MDAKKCDRCGEYYEDEEVFMKLEVFDKDKEDSLCVSVFITEQENTNRTIDLCLQCKGLLMQAFVEGDFDLVVEEEE